MARARRIFGLILCIFGLLTLALAQGAAEGADALPIPGAPGAAGPDVLPGASPQDATPAKDAAFAPVPVPPPSAAQDEFDGGNDAVKSVEDRPLVVGDENVALGEQIRPATPAEPETPNGHELSVEQKPPIEADNSIGKPQSPNSEAEAQVEQNPPGHPNTGNEQMHDFDTDATSDASLALPVDAGIAPEPAMEPTLGHAPDSHEEAEPAHKVVEKPKDPPYVPKDPEVPPPPPDIIPPGARPFHGSGWQNPWHVPMPGGSAEEIQVGAVFKASWYPNTEGKINIELWRSEDGAYVPKYMLACS